MTAKPPALQTPAEPSKTLWRRYLRAGVWLLLMGGAIVLWEQRGAVLQWALTQGLQNTLLLSPKISGARFDFQQAELANLQFTLQTPNGAITAELEGIKADYDLPSARLNNIKMAKARLRFVYQAANKAAGEQPTTDEVLALPVRQLNIEQLDLELDTPWGMSRFAGRFDADLQPGEPLLIVLADAEQVIKAEVNPQSTNAKLAIQQSAGRGMMDLDLDRPAPTRLQANLKADLHDSMQWLKSNSLIPEQLRDSIFTAAVVDIQPNLAGVQVNLSAQSDDDLANLTGRVELTRNQAYLASAELALNTSKQRWAIDGHVDLPLGEFVGLIKPWLPETVNAWQFPAGQVMGSVRLNRQPKRPLKGEIYLNGYQLGILAGPVKADDGYIRFAVKDFVKLAMQVEVDAPNLQIGQETTLHNLQFKARLNNRDLSLDRFSMPALGGLLSIDPETVNIYQRPVKFTLAVKNLDLAQLLDSLNYPQLSGTGTLTGKLPLRLALDSIELKDGKLNATRPGVLHYQGPVSDNENLAFSALRNLQYHSLQAKLNYQPDGHYQVGLRLEGKNPQVLSGHAIAFNLNLNGLLPDLLQKGILAGDFEKPILEQVKAVGRH
ncbi:intermembrane phospholipid transport protein YdbH family protein [Methylomonas methanica]|uniref:Uncharacterized protein n=1 Tax=Methylomonas methanica (strain DSM 25384 / MC09) TaxID=857087 RepID=G0A0I7_METMM|nr:YdbH domain-containing protein [Methylomonas methanica]AEF98763.1 hypothetical protein Metme_0314 [Methylomonas methanica MC09]